MFTTRLSFNHVHFLAIIATLSGFLLTSSAQAVFVGEAHACNADSETGGYWSVGGGFYFPGARSSRIYQYEVLSEPVYLVVNLTAYEEGSTTYTTVAKTSFSPVGVWYNQAAAVVTDPDTAPGRALAMTVAWMPTISRARSGNHDTYALPIEANGCKNDVDYF